MVDVLAMSRLDFIKNFSGKYVFVGESGTAIHDSIISPVSGTNMDGVEVHAHLLDGLLQDKMLSPLDEKWMMIAVVILTLLAVIQYYYVPKFLSPIFAIVTLIGILYVVRYTYDIGRVVTDVSLLFLA